MSVRQRANGSPRSCQFKSTRVAPWRCAAAHSKLQRQLTLRDWTWGPRAKAHIRWPRLLSVSPELVCMRWETIPKTQNRGR